VRKSRYCAYTKRCKALKKDTMDNIETIEKMFSEIGLDEKNKQALTEKIHFDFDYSKQQSQTVIEIITTNNTKNE